MKKTQKTSVPKRSPSFANNALSYIDVTFTFLITLGGRSTRDMPLYSDNILIEASIKKNFLDIKYYVASFVKHLDKKSLINSKDPYGRPAIFYSAYFSIFIFNIF